LMPASVVQRDDIGMNFRKRLLRRRKLDSARKAVLRRRDPKHEDLPLTIFSHQSRFSSDLHNALRAPATVPAAFTLVLIGNFGRFHGFRRVQRNPPAPFSGSRLWTSCTRLKTHEIQFFSFSWLSRSGEYVHTRSLTVT